MAGTEPDKLIEHKGYVYKLMLSKEEQLKIDQEKLKNRERAFGAFKQKIGSEAYDYLHTSNVTLSYETGGNYSVTVYFDFGKDETWKADEYSNSDHKHFGDADWYSYDYSKFENTYVSAAIHKMLQDYFFGVLWLSLTDKEKGS